jgi:hypothetical protein
MNSSTAGMEASQSLWRATGRTGLLYVIFAAIVVLLNGLYPADICNPGAGVLLLLGVPALSIVLLVKDFIQWRFYYQQKQLSVVLHLLILGCYAAAFSNL